MFIYCLLYTVYVAGCGSFYTSHYGPHTAHAQPSLPHLFLPYLLPLYYSLAVVQCGWCPLLIPVTALNGAGWVHTTVICRVEVLAEMTDTWCTTDCPPAKNFFMMPLIFLIIIIIITITSSHIFQPLALETLGPINTTGITFFSDLGRRLTDISGDPRETTYLFQRVSLAVSSVTVRWHSEAPSRSPLNWTSATPACFVFNFCF